MSIDYEAVYADVTDVNVLKQKRRAQRSMIGSGITLITSRLAQSLKAKKHHLVHEITGLNGTKCLTSKYVVNLS